MPEGPARILGGLPVWAEVSFYRGDGWSTDDDAEVDTLFWQKRDGSKGKEVTQTIYDRCEAYDDYWQCDVIDMVCDYLAHEQYERELMDVRCRACKGTGKHREWSDVQRLCPKCKGTGTHVSRVRAGLSDYVWFD